MQSKVLKMNLSGLCENAWFPWQPIMLFKNGAYKITHILATTCPRLLNMVSNKFLDRGLSFIVAYANYLLYLICITIYENIKM